ncbi:MAG TPA: tyrosine-protein phosphatase [Candidatus Limnocylindria bacterium]|nr:tyrosine-protein phosphatase [Candidatus Limnocylindria bacterium]
MKAAFAANPRILDWEGVLNARDTGGIPAATGVVRRGGLVRSGVLNGLTPAGVAALTAHGVRTVIDVRAADEVADHWDRYPLRDHPLVGYRNISFTAGFDEAMRDQVRTVYGAAQSREEINRLDLDNHRAGIATIVGAIADAPEGGVLIHCHAGKDRTGLVVAIILSALGVSDEDIADDYALSQLVLDELVKEWFAYMGAAASEQGRLRTLADPSREAMLGTLAHLHLRYGSATDYLLGAGVTEDQLEKLRMRLVETS